MKNMKVIGKINMQEIFLIVLDLVKVLIIIKMALNMKVIFRIDIFNYNYKNNVIMKGEWLDNKRHGKIFNIFNHYNYSLILFNLL